MRRFELRSASSSKFWEVTLSGTTMLVAWGKIGTRGQSTEKSFASVDEARRACDKLVEEKVAKGYAEVAEKGAPPEVSPQGLPDVATPARAALSKNLTALIGLIERLPKRAKEPTRAAGLLARNLAPDLRALIEGWRAHGPLKTISLGDVTISETTIGAEAPREGDEEMSEPGRDDVVAFAQSGGGDLFAIKRNKEGAFLPRVRLVHDDGWRERKVAASLEAFIDQCESAAKKNDERTSLSAALEEARPLKAAPAGRLGVTRAEALPREKPAAAIARAKSAVPLTDDTHEARAEPGRDDRRVALSADGRRALVCSSRTVHLVDIASGQVTKLAQGIAFIDVAFLAGDAYAVLKRGGYGGKGNWRSYSRPHLLVGSLAHPAQPRRAFPMSTADWLTSLADGEILAVGTRANMHKKTRNLTSFFRWTKGGLYRIVDLKRSLVGQFYDDGLYQAQGRWFASGGVEIVNIDAELQRPVRERALLEEVVRPPQAVLKRAKAAGKTAVPTKAVRPSAKTPSLNERNYIETLHLGGLELCLQLDKDSEAQEVTLACYDAKGRRSKTDVGCAATWLAVSSTWAVLTPIDDDMLTNRPKETLEGDIESYTIVARDGKCEVATLSFAVTDAWTSHSERWVRDAQGHIWQVLDAAE